MRRNVCLVVCLWQLFCLLSVSAIQSTADVNGMSVGFPTADSGSATTELVPRANMRIQGANSGLAVATVTGSFVLAAAICSAGTGAACIIFGVFSVIQGWAATFLIAGSSDSNNAGGNSARGLPFPEYEFTVSVGGGAFHLDNALSALVHPDHFAQDWYQEMLHNMRSKEPHYMTFTSDGMGRSSAMWFVNETSHPGINELKKRDGTVVTEVFYTWDNENEDRFNEYDKRSDAMSNDANEVSNFCADNFENKFCLGFDDDDQANPQVNYGELYFNEQGGIDGDCNAANQGVFKRKIFM